MPSTAPPPPVVPPSEPGAAVGSTPERKGFRFGAVVVGLLLFVVAQLVVGVAVLAALAITGTIDLSGPLSDDDLSTLTNWTLPLAAGASWVAFIAVPVWVARRRGSGSARADLGLSFRPIDIGWGIVGWIVALVSAGAIGGLYSLVRATETPTNTDIITSDGTQIGMFLMLLFVVGIGTPIAEEVFFRGLVLRAGMQRFGTAGGVAVSSIIFGVMHVFAVAGFTLEALEAMAFLAVVTSVLGLVFAWLRIMTGRLAAPIVAHMIFNSVTVVVITFA